MMIGKRWTSFFNPEFFQGWGRKKRYFEGWYYKFLNRDTSIAFSVIPGIAFDESGKGQAFIQILDGKRKTSAYHRFPLDTFNPSAHKLHVEIGDNIFTGSSLRLNLPELQGELHFSDQVPWPKPFYSPGIMGPYSFAPFMECYHGIVSMDHTVSGILTLHQEEHDFQGGRGYIEKDWGRSFPSAYVWMQSNHFSEPGISLKASVAKIPWLRSSFTGFIAGLWLKDRLLRFTTYNGTKLLKCEVDPHKIELTLQNPKYRLEIKAFPDKAVSLAAPVRGAMEGRIEESMSSRIKVSLIAVRSGEMIFQDTGYSAAMEIAGKIDDIRI